MYKVVPADAGAKFVVSEIGDILSPKNEPEMTIPAVTAGGIPIPLPIPIIAIPIVPIVPQDVPMDIDVKLHKSKPTGKKTAGLIYCNP